MKIKYVNTTLEFHRYFLNVIQTVNVFFNSKLKVINETFYHPRVFIETVES